MLRSNLSTRPFYNERLVTLGLLLVALLAIALTAFNVLDLRESSARRSELQAQIDMRQQNIATVNAEANRLRQTVDRQAFQLLVLDTHEANGLIEQRTFSWTTFLSVIEKTLPIDVRLVSVSPKFEKGDTKVTMTLVTKTQENLNAFRKALENTGGMFYDVLPVSDQSNDDGTYNATIAAYYLAPSLPVKPKGRQGGRP